jgi:hypothetical protein
MYAEQPTLDFPGRECTTCRRMLKETARFGLARQAVKDARGERTSVRLGMHRDKKEQSDQNETKVPSQAQTLSTRSL